MGSRCVVILAPLFDRALGVRQVDEPVLVETLVPEPTVETFYERVLRRLSRKSSEIREDVIKAIATNYDRGSEAMQREH